MNDNINPDEIFRNRAEVTGMEKQHCENCEERLVFALKDSKGNTFSFGISNLLECLKVAVNEGYLPELPGTWVSLVKREYPFFMSEED